MLNSLSFSTYQYLYVSLVDQDSNFPRLPQSCPPCHTTIVQPHHSSECLSNPTSFEFHLLKLGRVVQYLLEDIYREESSILVVVSATRVADSFPTDVNKHQIRMLRLKGHFVKCHKYRLDGAYRQRVIIMQALQDLFLCREAGQSLTEVLPGLLCTRR